MNRISFVAFAALSISAAATAGAQGNGRNVDGVPPGHRPPAGMCRVWVDGVPPGRQSGVTDCATARARASVTANSRVIYGDDNPKRKSSRTNDDWCDGWGRTSGTSILGAIINGSSGSCSNDVWYGRDTNGDGVADIFARRRVDANGRVIIDRGRRGDNGNIVVINSRTRLRSDRFDDDDDRKGKWDHKYKDKGKDKEKGKGKGKH